MQYGNVKPYIFFSTPGEVDYDAYLKISSIKKTLSAYGGIISNAIFCIITGLIIIFCSPENIYISFCLWLFLSFCLFIIVYNICTVISMCAGRIIFSIKHKRDNNS